MPATHQRQPTETGSQRARSYKSGPMPNVQMPQLPKQLEGKFVKGEMYKYQDSLPKLPVPPLDQTLEKYLKGVEVNSAVHSITLCSANGTMQYYR